MTFQRGYRGSGETAASTGRLCTRGTNRPTDIRSYIRGNIAIERDIGTMRQRKRRRRRRRRREEGAAGGQFMIRYDLNTQTCR